MFVSANSKAFQLMRRVTEQSPSNTHPLPTQEQDPEAYHYFDYLFLFFFFFFSLSFLYFISLISNNKVLQRHMCNHSRPLSKPSRFSQRSGQTGWDLCHLSSIHSLSIFSDKIISILNSHNHVLS